ncbi:hypothetical protein A2331_02325 [Candidatus Falkowbacteria bacterium RIFOXYB2_FULL_34_18]|uniref:Uncharacterized protein n=1 Tax=Candidatus Falkowbacteria bacterium RIFOXYD2_FULL_34_120 TaxID=1798007 RepID=A0A1F5TSD0_9BACT|nr:MAG: hypothetical protein A2331_02325 [Candidatus Falkowbacteria bacterium RIFOXYB2_FULL_34_18]OGF29702.1 MAG: hypothetical protein A2500_00300 [Candidatus Falkowbacteria bacterium RIFOXYC12_FULL_34_55]OGF37433.1 MAG: hypothetical protein A2466_00420 [Candidatus Falkowbacteria bacterium RIFOXYC2_FULL_34_220]OGF39158.1 MAG: hypothetical protein A2515_00375 [Candidatus Falkowbacteria bacterium RIFOXYD12_FULL_34_57]OGF41707.1 MAG: hypothetical protein A2531_06095 [Candidatus Falkowbacteria bact
MRYFFTIIFLILFAFPVSANLLLDSDLDGVPDKDETGVYYTDPYNRDTDGDGYSDWTELNFGFSPHNSLLITLEENDLDGDGLSDRMELKFHTNLKNKDTDGDGYIDMEEIDNGYDPLSTEKIVLKKRIEIDTGRQNLKYFLGDVAIKEFVVSTGKPGMETPKGHFKVDYKDKKAWSAKYGLWMPYWMSLQNGYFGIHELPEWPGGYKEGVDHLGKPVSHGCIRLGVGDAEFLYNWAPMGTEVFIY